MKTYENRNKDLKKKKFMRRVRLRMVDIIFNGTTAEDPRLIIRLTLSTENSVVSMNEHSAQRSRTQSPDTDPHTQQLTSDKGAKATPGRKDSFVFVCF